MATIALYRTQINRMPGLIRDVRQTVTDYQNELSALKRKVLKINKSICNLDDVICQIQASTRLQEEKSDSLDKLKQKSEEFTQEAVRIDEAVAEVVRQRSDHFYEKYGYLKPECRQNWTDQANDWFTKAGAWCREHWKAVASVVLVIAAVLLLCTGVGGILGAVALGALLGGAIGGVVGGLISMAMGGTFWEGFENGAFAGVVGGMLSGGMGFAIAGKAALSLGETIAVGAVSGGGVSFVNDMGSIIIGGEPLPLGEVIRNTLAGGVFGGVFAGIGYGISRACAGVWNKLVGSIKGGGGAKWQSKDPLVGNVANAIDDAIPDKVSDVNKIIRDSSGQIITDLDIELDNVVIQVKSGGGKGLTTQLKNTANATGKETIGYVPDAKPSIIKGAVANGFKVFTNLEDMINYLKGK